MRFTDFINELGKAGWQDTGDAQHKNIEHLHRKLFPVIAQLENEIEVNRMQLTTTIEGNE